jgi:hypothetical protein
VRRPQPFTLLWPGLASRRSQDGASSFNVSLEGNVRRAIDFHESDKIDEKALKALIRAAVALNTSSAAQR